MDADFSEFVERVKQANPIEDVIEQTGAEFKLHRRRGNYLRGMEHDSLVVRVDEQYYVWNEKGEKGDVFNWLEARNRWDFWSCLEFLAERAKLQMPARFAGGDQPGRVSARIREDAFGAAQRVLHKLLLSSEKGLAYCVMRGWDEEVIKAAGLGFTGDHAAAARKEMSGEFAMYGIEADSPAAVAILGWRGDVRSWGQKHEIAVQDNWIEWGFVPGMLGKKRIVYPHWTGGRCKYLSCRNVFGDEMIDGREVKSWNPPAVLAGARQAFYNHAYGRRAEMCVVVEGQADAVTLGVWDVPAVALIGTSWDDQEALMVALRERHAALYVGMDADEAGVKALIGRDEDWPMARALGPMMRVIKWNGG